MSFVGRLQIGALVVTIEPKLAKQELLTLVRYAYGLGDVQRLGSAAFATSGSLLPELLAAQLLDSVTELLARGLPRRYVERPAPARRAPRHRGGSPDLRDHLTEHEVVTELPLRGVLRYASDASPRGRRDPGMRPAPVLLDAKYRDLWEQKLPGGMLYQLAMYATSGAGSPTAAMLYLTSAVSATEARTEVRDVFTDEQRGVVAMRPVILPRLVELLWMPVGASARQAEAKRMAFGA